MTWFRIGTGASAHHRDEDDPAAICGRSPTRRKWSVTGKWFEASPDDPRCARCVRALAGQKQAGGRKARPSTRWGRAGLPVVDEEVVPSVHILPEMPGEPVHLAQRSCWCEPRVVERGEVEVIKHVRRSR
jgi:hypothetical protein